MRHSDFKDVVDLLLAYHTSHHPNGVEKTPVSQSIESDEASREFHIAACENTIQELRSLGGIPLRCFQTQSSSAMDYKAESARLSLELTLWKNYKDFQEYLRLNELCRFMVKERFNNSKWCEEDLLGTLKQFFDQKAYEAYHFWILETVMERAKEAQEGVEDAIENGTLNNAGARRYGKTADEWLGLFDLYSVIADTTRVTISEIEQVSLNLSSDLAERAGSQKRFDDVKRQYRHFITTVAKETEGFTFAPQTADKTSTGDGTFVGTLAALDRQISYLMRWALSWDVASRDVAFRRTFVLPALPTSDQMQEQMLAFLTSRAERFQAFSDVWQEIVPHIEGKIQGLVSQRSTGNAAPASLYEELERAQKAAMGNLSAAWAMQQRLRMTKVQFDEVNRGVNAPAQWAVEASSSKSGGFFPETRIFRPVMDKVATTVQTPKVSVAAASTERAAKKDEAPAPRPATPDDDLPDYEDFEDEDAGLPKKPEATTERQSKSPSPAPPSDKTDEEVDTHSPRYSLSPSPPPAPPSPVNDQPATNVRNASPPSSPSNKRKRSASPPDEEEKNDSRSPRHSPTPSPPPPKRARSASPAPSRSPPPSNTPSPPPPPPPPSSGPAAANVGNVSPTASPSNKRKRSASPAEEEEEEADDNRSPHHSATPSPPPAKRARSTSPAPAPSGSKADTDTEDDEPEGTTQKPRRGRKPAAKSTKGKGKAAVTKTGRVAKPRASYKKKDYRAEAQARGGVRRSTRVRDMKK